MESGAVEKVIDTHEGSITVDISIALCITSILIANYLSMGERHSTMNTQGIRDY